MLQKEKQLTFSNYPGLYDVVVPADHILRKIKEEIDFGFVNALLEDSYCKHFGRPAKEPEMMFKFLFLQHMYNLSDEKVTDQATYNMAFKYFLDLHPEDPVIHSSLLTKFRKSRVTKELLEKMLAETVRQAVDKGLLQSKAIIVDSTHSHSKGKPETPTEKLKKMSKALRRTVHQKQGKLAEVFPEKPKAEGSLEEEIAYCKALLFAIEEKMEHKAVKNQYDKVKRQIEEVGLLEAEKAEGTSEITEPTVGHKSEDDAFFGFKSHIAINDERLITGLTVTTGRHTDTDQLEPLTEQSMRNGQPVKELLGDTAYPSLDNLEYCEKNGIKLIAKLHPLISDGTPKNPEFTFNKDSGMLQCPEGHLAMSFQPSITKQETKNGIRERLSYIYYFSTKKCKKCPRNGTCYKGQKYKSCSITVANETHKRQSEFEKSEYFQTRRCDRYKIEAKNAELKQAHGLARCKYTGLIGMEIQSYFTAFVANAKRIVKLQGEKTGDGGSYALLRAAKDAMKAIFATAFGLQTA